MKTKLKIQNWIIKTRSKNFAKKVTSPVRTRSISWLILSNFIKLFILILFGALILFPFYYMISASLMTQDEATDKVKTHLVPEVAQWGNYKDAFADGYWKAILYSFSITAITIILKIFVTILLGYAFSYEKYRGKKVLWYFFLSMLMLPEVALLSGQYQMVVKLNWHYGSNVIMGLFIPFVASVFNAIMFKNAFSSIPNRIREASMVDGGSEVSYFFRVALPMIKPTTMLIIILTAFASWNSYMWPALLLQGSNIQTVPTWVFLTGKDTAGNTLVPIRLAGTVLAIAPMFIVYFAFRGKIMAAISRQGNSIKG